MAFLSFAQVTSAQEILFATARKTNPFSFEQRALRDVLKDIQAHFKISFVYESVLVEGKAITGSVVYKNSVEKTLSAVLTPIGLKYRKINKSTYSISSQFASCNSAHRRPARVNTTKSDIERHALRRQLRVRQ
jgi:hypothetical protein